MIQESASSLIMAQTRAVSHQGAPGPQSGVSLMEIE